MNGERRFLDSNIILYLLSSDHRKAATAETLMDRGGVISVQVLNEVASVMRRKSDCDWPEIVDVLQACEALLEVVPLDLASHRTARRVAMRYGFSVYDAMIVASALESGCHYLITEDLQGGQVIADQLTIMDPF